MGTWGEFSAFAPSRSSAQPYTLRTRGALPHLSRGYRRSEGSGIPPGSHGTDRYLLLPIRTPWTRGIGRIPGNRTSTPWWSRSAVLASHSTGTSRILVYRGRRPSHKQVKQGPCPLRRPSRHWRTPLPLLPMRLRPPCRLLRFLRCPPSRRKNHLSQRRYRLRPQRIPLLGRPVRLLLLVLVSLVGCYQFPRYCNPRTTARTPTMHIERNSLDHLALCSA